jgi:hypothetical protein
MDNIDEQIRKLVPNIGEGEFKRERAKLQASKQKVEQAEKKGGGGGEKKPQPATSDTPTHPDGTEIGRNDMVVISKSGEKKEMKYKKAKRLIDNEDWTFEGSAREE